ncbi:zinc finger protein ZFAT isoform X1 [Electrophorus electricus]|uniref:zinc finger protein ZFAT isoform X1 n=2 Tax=Electrophorus electricus TaxID=8005 RepID=UPI0015CF8858|nr:zinc finger protein ZFAT isoform X1 [Electrophorus electricus]
MDSTQAEGSSVFMCKICNLFSPSKPALLSHVHETHGDQGDDAEDLIIPLKPLQRPEAPSTEGVIKRKRGRPKGSTKKVQADETKSNKASGQPKKETADVPSELELTMLSEDGSAYECKKCQRKFSNKRQISKHICFAELKETAEEDDFHGQNPDTVKAVDDEEEDTECTLKKVRTMRTDKASGAKDSESASCTKNPIISVVLAAHEAIPGATKIVPIEAVPAEAVVPPESSVSSEDQQQKKGYQEYAIQQAAYEVPFKSNRLGQTQLKIFTCEYCNKVFKFKHSLQAHLRIHTNEKPFKCTHCDYASTIKANLSVHMRKHTGEKFSCDHCSFNCLSKGHLKVHVERVHKKIKQHCRFCKKKYSDVKNLLKHIRESHDMEDEKVKESYDEYRLQTREGKRQLLYDCQICDRKFKNELDRDRHLMVHGSKRPFGCELCDHGSTKFQALQAHIRKHPFVYVCAICLQKFVSSVRLKSHFRESHPESDESASFANSIQSSFCLLKPGDDIQRDMLKQDELEITKELSLLNAQEVLVSEFGTMEEQESQAQCSGSLTVEVDSLVQEGSQDGLPPTHIIHNCPVIEETQMQGTICQVGLDKEQLQDDMSNVDCSVTEFDSAGEGNIPLVSHSPAPETADMSNQKILSDDTNNITVAHNEVESNISQINAAPRGVEDSVTPHQEEKSAFMQILDQMQKRQLNMDVFERIRKVYGDLECEYCGKLFWYQVHYNMHVRTHTREHLHYCSQCSYSSITKNCLKRHVIQRHSNILLKCPSEGCQYCTPDKYKLQAHLKTHAEIVKKSFVCPVCKESLPEDRLRHHIKANHPDTSLSTISETLGIRVHVKGVIGKRASKCPYCDSYFTRNGADMQQHIWAHEGVRPFKCSLCDYASRSKSNLKAHLNRHSTEKTHLCDLCGKKFKSKCTLKSHKLVHSADGKQFKCTECDFTAAQKPHLLRHMEQHASFKPFRCAHCHYSCNISGSLKRHYNKKHPNEQYCNAGPGTAASETVIEQGGVKCPVCNYVYGTKWEMNRHLKCKHGLRVVEQDGLGLNQWEVVESVEEPTTQYLQITEAEDAQVAEDAASALQNLRFNAQNGVVSATAADRLDPASVNILQQIIELGTENPDTTVASVVTMAPGTVTVVEQVTEEEQQTDHAMMLQDALQQASTGLGEEHHLVVSSDDMEGIKTVTVYTQGEDASQFIVYVQESIQTEEATTEVA